MLLLCRWNTERPITAAVLRRVGPTVNVTQVPQVDRSERTESTSFQWLRGKLTLQKMASGSKIALLVADSWQLQSVWNSSEKKKWPAFDGEAVAARSFVIVLAFCGVRERAAERGTQRNVPRLHSSSRSIVSQPFRGIMNRLSHVTTSRRWTDYGQTIKFRHCFSGLQRGKPSLVVPCMTIVWYATECRPWR